MNYMRVFGSINTDVGTNIRVCRSVYLSVTKNTTALKVKVVCICCCGVAAAVRWISYFCGCDSHISSLFVQTLGERCGLCITTARLLLQSIRYSCAEHFEIYPTLPLQSFSTHRTRDKIAVCSELSRRSVGMVLSAAVDWSEQGGDVSSALGETPSDILLASHKSFLLHASPKYFPLRIFRILKSTRHACVLFRFGM